MTAAEALIVSSLIGNLPSAQEHKADPDAVRPSANSSSSNTGDSTKRDAEVCFNC